MTVKSVLVRDVAALLEEKHIPFELWAHPETILTKPVDWADFKGEGLAFYVGADTKKLLQITNPDAGLVICRNEHKANLKHGPFLFVEKPRLAFVIAAYLFVTEHRNRGIHPTAIIDPEAKLGKDVAIGSYSVIGKVEIGDNTKIGAMTSISDWVRIGSNVTVMNNVHLGDPSLGSVVDMEGNQVLFPHFEYVEIEDNVVIGTSTVIQRGVLTTTVIGKGTHIAANCFIGHNCRLGEFVYLAPGVFLAGKATISDRCFLGMGACIREAVTLAEEITVGMNTSITRSYAEPGIAIMAPPSITVGDMFKIKRG